MAGIQWLGSFLESIEVEGGDISVESLSVTKNGTYTAPSGKAYSPVSVNVPTGGDVTVESLSVTENGTYTAQPGKAYSPVAVNVPTGPVVEALNVTENGTYTPETGTAYGPVNVNVPAGPTVESLSVTQNGTYTAPAGKAYSPVSVNVPQTGIDPDDFMKTVVTGTLSGSFTIPYDGNVVKFKENAISNNQSTDPLVIYNGDTQKRFDLSENNCFNRCKNLTYIEAEGTTKNVGQNVFYGCSRLDRIQFPLVQSIGGYCFYNCNSLRWANLGLVSSLSPSMLDNCIDMQVLALLSNSATVVYNRSALSNTKFSSAENRSKTAILVPRSKIQDYETEWAAYVADGGHVFAYEDYVDASSTITGVLDDQLVTALISQLNA